MKILIATEKPFASEALSNIKHTLEAMQHDIVLLENYTDKESLLNVVNEVEAMIVRSDKIDKTILDAAKKLKLIVRAGAGVDSIDTCYAKDKGIAVANTPGQNANAVAELVFGMLIYSKRKYFSGKSGSELMNKSIGIAAYGNVGRNVARIAKGFGMQVYAYDPFISTDVFKDTAIEAVDGLEELFCKSDIVSLHMPATPHTRKIVNAALVQKMKNNAILVNTARKDIIDEEELLDTLLERKDLTYITDIKPDLHERFLALEDRYFTTPKKSGAQTTEANSNAGLAAAQQIIHFAQTGEVLFQVNH